MCDTAAAFDVPVMIDVPSTARRLDRLCNDLTLEQGFQTARMYKGPARATQAELFAVTSLEQA